MTTENKSFLSRLHKAKSGSTKTSFKRVFVSPGETEYLLRPVFTEAQDPDSLLYKTVYLHGGYKHPNYNNEYASNFHCGGKGCPLCADVTKIRQDEKENNVPKEQKTSWKKQRRKYAMYWMENRATNELSLVFIPDDAPQFKDADGNYVQESPSLQDLLLEKLEGAGREGKDPFSLTHGYNIRISSKTIEKKVKWTVRIEDKESPVSPTTLKKLESVDRLESVYKRYSHDELASIASGQKILSEKEKNESSAKSKDESSKEQINKLNNEEKVDYTDHSFVEDEDLLLSDDTAYELDDSPAGGSGFGNMFSDLYSKDKKE